MAAWNSFLKQILSVSWIFILRSTSCALRYQDGSVVVGLKLRRWTFISLRLCHHCVFNLSFRVVTFLISYQDAKIDPEEFTSRLQTELKSSPQPYLVPFLKVVFLFVIVVLPSFYSNISFPEPMTLRGKTSSVDLLKWYLTITSAPAKT